MTTIQELQETAALLQDATPADTDEMAAVCAEIHAARDFEETVKAAEKQACAELEAQLIKLKEPFKAQRAAASAVIEAATAALVRRLEQDEQAALDAIVGQTQVPAPRELPRGLRTTRKTTLKACELTSLPEEYVMEVPDVEAILKAAEAGLEIPGAQVDVVIGCVYTRPKK